MTKAAIVTTPFPSFAETASKYGLSAGDRLEIQRAVDEIVATTPTRRDRKQVRGVHGASKKK